MLLRYFEEAPVKLQALARNQQRFRTLTINNMRILDSAAHLPSSLSKLADILRQDANHQYPLFRQSSIINNISTEERKLAAIEKLSRKGQVSLTLIM